MEDPIDMETLLRPDDAAPSSPSSKNRHPYMLHLNKSSHITQKFNIVYPQQGPLPSWLNVRVFYVRASSCIPDEAPNSLLIVYPPRNISTELEVNGCRISPSERACFVLRRDRVDAGTAEATYVSTDNLRMTGDLSFEIYDKDELIILGTLAKAVSSIGHDKMEDYTSVLSLSSVNKEAGWTMDCGCGISSFSCAFLKGRLDFSTSNPTMEVYVAGQTCGLPLALTTTVQLSVRRRTCRQSRLDVIPEVEESQSDRILTRQIADDEAYDKMNSHPFTMGFPANSFYMPIGGSHISEGEEGELSWFNAGVRVGVGIGLGLCLGVGIGVGLLARPFKRRLL